VRESARVGSYVRLLHAVLLTLCCVCSSSLHEGSSLSCGSTRLPRTRSRSTPWKLASTRCVARERHLLRSRMTFCICLARPILGYCNCISISHNRPSPLPSHPECASVELQLDKAGARGQVQEVIEHYPHRQHL
jgi:hypothetical protein